VSGGTSTTILPEAVTARGHTIRHARFSDGELSGRVSWLSEKVQKMPHFYTGFPEYTLHGAGLPKYAKTVAL
jgi:hypothetical protein